MALVHLRKLQYGDENFLYRLMNSDQDIVDFSLKSDFSKWQKMVDWAVKNPNDLFWKITITERDDNGSDGMTAIDCGYIGFTSAIEKGRPKVALQSIASKVVDTVTDKHLVLEIYILKEFRGRDIATIAYHDAINIIKEANPGINIHIYASTYNTNLRAQRFFVDSLGMGLSHYYSFVSTVFKRKYSPTSIE